MVSITGLAHEVVRSVLKSGDRAIDGTAGNGHDTLFLAQLVGSFGQVWAMDLQPAALASTSRRLQQHGCFQVQLRLGNHAQLHECLPEEMIGTFGAAMFNLGYLPHQDHRLTTLAATTLPALSAAWTALRPCGILSVVTYRGHPGGEEEALAVEEWMQNTGEKISGPFRYPDLPPIRGPQLLAIKRAD